MFSEELKELDRNTVQLMIDEMQEEIDRQRTQIENQRKENIRLLEAEKSERIRRIRRSYEKLGNIESVADFWEISVDEAKKILEIDEE